MSLELTSRESIAQGLAISDEIIDKILDQPTDGLLWDLDLMPEQCQTNNQAVWCRVIQRLHQRYTELKNTQPKTSS